jgi:H+-transporting ATPase
VVLTEPGLSTIIRAIIISRQIVQRMKNYLIYRISVTVQLLLFFFMGALFMSPARYNQEKEETDEDSWPDVFALPVSAVVIITILNDGTIISIAYDNVLACKQPEKWHIVKVGGVTLFHNNHNHNKVDGDVAHRQGRNRVKRVLT